MVVTSQGVSYAGLSVGPKGPNWTSDFTWYKTVQAENVQKLTSQVTQLGLMTAGLERNDSHTKGCQVIFDGTPGLEIDEDESYWDRGTSVVFVF